VLIFLDEDFFQSLWQEQLQTGSQPQFAKGTTFPNDSTVFLVELNFFFNIASTSFLLYFFNNSKELSKIYIYM